MSNTITIKNREPQIINISGGAEIIGITTVYVNGIDVTEGNVAYVIVPTKTSELLNDSGYITSETDPTIPYYIKQITQADINNWNSKQEQLVSGVNIKTINSNSILGSGNLDISTSYTAGDGIEITEDNIINNLITSYDDLEDLPTIPTMTSQLTNDSDFVSRDELSNVAFDGSYLDLSDTPDNLSDFNNDEGFISMDFLWDILPKSSDTGATISLDDTVKNAPLYLTLSPSELSQDGTPTPSSPQDIHTISGSNTIKIENSNLLPLTNQDFTHKGMRFYVSNGMLYFNGTATGTISTTDSAFKDNLSFTIPAGTYYFTRGDGELLSAPTYLRKVSDDTALVTNDGSFTLTETTEVYFGFYYNTNTTFNNVGIHMQMVKGSTRPTTWEAYTLETADVNLGDIEYCKIGTYEDKFIRSNDGTWQLEKNIVKGIIDGTGNLVEQTISAEIGNRFYTPDFNSNILRRTNSQLPILICNRLLPKSPNQTYLGNEGMSVDSSGNVLIYSPDWKSKTDTELKTLLETNNLIFYYALATPTYTPITGTLATQLENVYRYLTSENEQTNISQTNNDLPFVISAVTIKSLINI